MKRQSYTATLLADDGTVLGTTTKFAMNSAIRETESLVRTLARSEGVYYEGEKPGRVGNVYSRRWVSTAGRVVNVRAELPVAS